MSLSYSHDHLGLVWYNSESSKKNQTENLARYTMYTGSGNPYNLSKISLFNGKKSLGIWSDETEGATCNKVQGSDGATFNPYVRTHHMFLRILNFLFVIVFSRKKGVFD